MTLGELINSLRDMQSIVDPQTRMVVRVSTDEFREISHTAVTPVTGPCIILGRKA